ncbi:MAG: hypothetical protein DRI71_05850 [Bacteroidetes bacterium]|nr:MAG: hypothetical protein DRI71_05850 [Bacteroidota bacterium]
MGKETLYEHMGFGSSFGGGGGFFGGGGDEGGGDGASVMQLPLKTEEQNETLKRINEFITERIGKGMPGYEGQLSAGPGGIQQNAFDLAQQLTGGGGNFGRSQEVLGGMLEDFDPASTKAYFENSIQAPALHNFERNIIPSIQSSFAGMNAGSSGAMNRALAESGRNLTTDLSSQLGSLLYQGEHDQKGRQFDAAKTSLDSIFNIGSVLGSQQQGLEQGALNRDYSEFLRTQAEVNPIFSLLGPALGTMPFENVVSGGTNQEGLGIGDLLAGGGSVLGGLGSIASGGGFGSIF